MRSFLKAPLLLLAAAASLLSPAHADRKLQSLALSTCQDNSGFSASLFRVTFTPNNNTAFISMVATSSIHGYVNFDVSVQAYGYQIIRQAVDPCKTTLSGLCPMVAGKIPLDFNLNLGEGAAANIPGIAYAIPDLDAKVRVLINSTDGSGAIACVEADISNGKTVDLAGVKWATAIISGLALISSAIVNGLGQYNTAAHVAANSLSLFGYFQSQAIVGLTSVKMPPIVMAWTQDFQWSLGIIRVGFLQDLTTWYQRATGGKPSTIFDSMLTRSVLVQKRGLDVAEATVNTGVDLFNRAVAMAPKVVHSIAKRANIETSQGTYVVYGIQRVAFRAKIETTNLFMTGLIFFVLFGFFTVLGVAAFKGICELLAKNQIMKNDRFLDFRNGWLTVLKGILYRVALLGFPGVTLLCLWEFTQIDSPAEVVLAVVFLFGLVVTLGWGASKVIRIARRSIAMHKNPAYILFSDPQALNRWGFLYMQFRASAYYCIVPVLVYALIKSMVIAFGQNNSVAQAICLLIVEVGALIAASVMRPWMDKPTNSFNIAICVINFLNAVFLLIFSNIFSAPTLMIGIVGVVLFVLNAAFSLILLLMVIISTTISFFRKNPDARYQYMADDRASFMKSQTQLNGNTELDALGATARGDKMGGYKAPVDLDDDHDSLLDPGRQDPFSSNNQSQTSFHQGDQGPRSPVNPSMPLFPGARSESPYRSQSPSPSQSNPYGNQASLGPSPQRGPIPNRGPSPQHGRAPSPQMNRGPSPQMQSRGPSPQMQSRGPPPQQRAPPPGQGNYRQQNSSSPWQRGAGYDH
ncbi:Flavin carrier protein 2 [Beauveria bassiana]|nr:Flavin carrier protein 2 [Beauveria bassiana]KAH8709063.1 Flavin carrier protein 2 [Beauveria bassiana]